MPKQIVVQYAQSIAVDVEEGDSVDVMLDKIKQAVDEQHYPPSGHKYLEFIITECQEAPELIDEMLD